MTFMAVLLEQLDRMIAESRSLQVFPCLPRRGVVDTHLEDALRHLSAAVAVVIMMASPSVRVRNNFIGVLRLVIACSSEPRPRGSGLWVNPLPRGRGLRYAAPSRSRLRRTRNRGITASSRRSGTACSRCGRTTLRPPRRRRRTSSLSDHSCSAVCTRARPGGRPRCRSHW